jgi:hypothetical protein
MIKENFWEEKIFCKKSDFFKLDGGIFENTISWRGSK